MSNLESEQRRKAHWARLLSSPSPQAPIKAMAVTAIQQPLELSPQPKAPSIGEIVNKAVSFPKIEKETVKELYSAKTEPTIR